YQHIFEKANVHIQGAVGPIAEEDLYHGILWGLITAIKGGQTGTVDMYYGRPSLPDFGCEPALRAYQDAGLRTAFGLVSRDQNTYAHEPDEQFLARLPAELAAEVRASPMGYAWAVVGVADLGVLTPETVVEHFVWVTADELAVFADSGAVASNNPGSNLRLSTGICRVRDIMDAGGRIAFGTDGISFSDRDDFFTELRLACYLQRLPREFGQGRLDGERVL